MTKKSAENAESPVVLLESLSPEDALDVVLESVRLEKIDLNELPEEMHEAYWERMHWEIQDLRRGFGRVTGCCAASGTLGNFAEFLARSGRIPADAERIRRVVGMVGEAFHYLTAPYRYDIETFDWVEYFKTGVAPHGYFYDEHYIDVELAKGNAPYVDLGVPPSPEYLAWFERFVVIMNELAPTFHYPMDLYDLPHCTVWEGTPAPWQRGGASYRKLVETHDFYWFLTAVTQRFGASIDVPSPEALTEALLALDALDPAHLNLSIFAPIATVPLEDHTP